MQIPRGEHPFRINMTNPRFSICNNILLPGDVSCCQLNISFHCRLPYPNSQIMTVIEFEVPILLMQYMALVLSHEWERIMLFHW